MTTQPLPTGPDSEAIARVIRETYPDADVVTAMGAMFFSRGLLRSRRLAEPPCQSDCSTTAGRNTTGA